MKALFATSLIAVAAAHAGPTEDAIIATMRLTEAPNYSWHSSVTDDARTYDIAGRTIRGGFTRVKMPVVAAVRRKLGRSVTDTQIELIFRGNAVCVIETDTGWVLPSELPAATTDDPRFGQVTVGLRPPGGSGGGPGAGVLPQPPTSPRGPAAYSNLQLAISHPHEELAVIVSGHTALLFEGNTVSGRLTELAAQLLLVHDGQGELLPGRAEGTFQLWLRAGQVVRYKIQLEGLVSIQTRSGVRAIAVRQTTVTAIKDVGRTSFDVPEEARAKLTR